jgi:hypothetical protein
MMKTRIDSGTQRLDLERALRVDLEDDLPTLGDPALHLRARRPVAVAVDLGPLKQASCLGEASNSRVEMKK